MIVAARADGISVAVHLEPYGGRTVSSTVADIAYLRNYGITSFYVYRPFDLAVGDWAAAKTALHAGGVKLYRANGAGRRRSATPASTASTPTTSSPTAATCSIASALRRTPGTCVCAPSVGPGYDARRGSDDPRVKPRRNGATYDAMWRAAIASGADRVTITSFNEWHEGTQIEPAAPARATGSIAISPTTARGACTAWPPRTRTSTRTRYWSDVFRSTSPVQLKTSAS